MLYHEICLASGNDFVVLFCIPYGSVSQQFVAVHAHASVVSWAQDICNHGSSAGARSQRSNWCQARS